MTTDSKPSAATGLRQTLGLGRPDSGWLRDPHFMLAALAAVPVWIALGLLVGERMQVTFAATALLAFVVLQPAVEEFAFRGALQGSLLDRGWTRRIGPVSIANLGTTVAFVALHFVAQAPAWAIAVAVPSLVFGHMRERFSSALPAMALHSVYNAGFAVTAWWVHH